MSTSFVAKGSLTAAAAAMTLLAAAPGFAQTSEESAPANAYDSGRRVDYDCRREQDNRAVAGAVIGGILGAVFGSGVAAHGVRTEGAVLGGGLGALGGAAVGADTAACKREGYRRAYEDGDSGAPYAAAEDERYQPRSEQMAAASNDDDWRPAVDDDYNDYAYDEDGRAYPVSEGSVGPDGCALAESAIYMPDGQVQKRFVRVCRDRSGRYQVVE